MAIARFDLRSTTLDLATSFMAVVPEEPAPQGGYSILYLLHGLSDDCTAWLRNTRLEQYAQGQGLVVLMPQVARSYYVNEAHGLDYWTFLTQELTGFVHSALNVTTRRERTFVAGVSMGGYGAMRWAFKEPERFAAAASLSGGLGIAQRTVDPSAPNAIVPRLGDTLFDGRDVTGTEYDLLWQIEQADPASLPAFYTSCGTQDPLYPENVAFEQAAADAGLDLTIDNRPGAHTWDYWDAQIAEVIAWLPAGERARVSVV